jgi:UDP-N-acetylglucosamine 1-carboxyvinyltransferase
MFESRMFFTDKLVSMGARMVLCDPHRVVVVGPSRLHGGWSRARTSAPGWRC